MAAIEQTDAQLLRIRAQTGVTEGDRVCDLLERRPEVDDGFVVGLDPLGQALRTSRRGGGGRRRLGADR